MPMKNKWLLLLLAGLLLLVIALPVSEPENRKTKEAETDTVNEEDYASMAEAKLEKILAQMEGAGKVKVMITLSSSSEKLVEKAKETSKAYTHSTSSETTESAETTDEAQTPYVAKDLNPAGDSVVVSGHDGDETVGAHEMNAEVE